MNGYHIHDNQFIDVMQGVMLNGGRDNLIYNNYFEDVDHVTWLSDECKNVQTYDALVNLRGLDLNENEIYDVTPLSALANLQVLGLDSNQISDVTPLLALVKLTWLKLNAN
jgi:internalin A